MLALFSAVPYTPPLVTDDGKLDLAAHLTNTSLQTDKGDENVRLLDELIGCNILGGPVGETLSHEDVQDIQDQIAGLVGEIFQAALGMSVHYQVCFALIINRPLALTVTLQALPNAFELYGLDFIVSHHNNPNATRKFSVSLLEVNSEPAIELTGPRLTWILEDLFAAIAHTCVAPFFSSDTSQASTVGSTLRKCLDVNVRGNW